MLFGDELSAAATSASGDLVAEALSMALGKLPQPTTAKQRKIMRM
jgi:hypothetical protein